jgi:hypothetical protein
LYTYPIDGANSPSSISLFSIPKADLIGGAPTDVNLTRFNRSLETVGFTIQAAVDFGFADGRAALLSSNILADPSSLWRSSIEDGGTPFASWDLPAPDQWDRCSPPGGPA